MTDEFTGFGIEMVSRSNPKNSCSEACGRMPARLRFGVHKITRLTAIRAIKQLQRFFEGFILFIPLPKLFMRRDVLFIGYLEATLGLGESLRGLVRSIATSELPFALYPYRFGVETRLLGAFMEDRYELGSVHEINVIEMAPDQVPQMFWKVGWWRTCCSYNILRSYWELSRAPPQWIGMLRRIHEIWVPNEFVRRAFEEVFTGPINVVPPCIEVEVNDRFERQYFNLDKNRFYFMLSFDYYSHPSRKNPLGVMRSFNMAFPNPAEEVGLVIKSTGAADNWPGIKLAIMEAAHHDQRIKIMDETFSRDEMLSLIANSDCYVSLHRAEGFGLGMAEAMALGKPVIGTDYSGSTDFLSETTAFPVSCTLRPLSPGEYIFSEGQGWVDPDEVAAAEAMRDVHSDQQERQERAANGRAFVEDRYDRNSVGRIAARRLQDILAARISRGSVPPPSLRPKSLARTGTRENASVYHKERT